MKRKEGYYWVILKGKKRGFELFWIGESFIDEDNKHRFIDSDFSYISTEPIKEPENI